MMQKYKNYEKFSSTDGHCWHLGEDIMRMEHIPTGESYEITYHSVRYPMQQITERLPEFMVHQNNRDTYFCKKIDDKGTVYLFFEDYDEGNV